MTWESRGKRFVFATSLVLVAGSALVLGCKKDKPNAPEPVQSFIADSLVFQRADSTVIDMGTATLFCCGLYDPSFVNERAMRIMFYDPAFQKSGWQILIL